MPTAQILGDDTEPSKPPAHPAEELPALIAQARATYHYLDRVDVRADKWPSTEMLDDLGGEILQWALPYHIRIMCSAPTPQQLKALARTGWPVCYFEPAVARIYDDPAVPPRLNKLYLAHLLVLFHGKHRIVTDHDTICFGQRRRGRGWRFPVCYPDLPCKVTGELDCFKLEWRLAGVAQVRNAVPNAAVAGIVTGDDLLSFDIAAYCRKHERLAYIDAERLARFHTNRIRDERRRDPDPDDRRLGHRLLQRFGRTDQGHQSVQAFLDNYRPGKKRPFLIPIPLPEPRARNTR